MKPLMLGGRDRPVFALFTPAEGPRKRRSALICPPLGQEYVRAHRSLALLGRQLSRAGLDVMRFDYFGTGDSGGDGEEVTLDGCVGDARLAAAELAAMTGVDRVSFVGLRLGATIAGRAARESGVRVGTPSDGAVRSVRAGALVGWDPVEDGAAYADLIREEADAVRDGAAHWRGFPFSESLLDEIADVAAWVPPPSPRARSLAIASQCMRGPANFEVIACEPCWTEQGNSGHGAVPAPVIRRIVEWVAA